MHCAQRCSNQYIYTKTKIDQRLCMSSQHGSAVSHTQSSDAAKNYVFYSMLRSKCFQRLSGSRRAWKEFYLMFNGNSVLHTWPSLCGAVRAPAVDKQLQIGFQVALGCNVQMFMANKKPATNIFLQHVHSLMLELALDCNAVGPTLIPVDMMVIGRQSSHVLLPPLPQLLPQFIVLG